MAGFLSQTLTIVLLLFIVDFDFCTGQLICWNCNPCPDPFSNTSSLVSAVSCTSSQIACVKNTIKVLNQASQISKGCVSSCTPSSSNFFGQGAFVDCCTTNYCNFSRRNQASSLLPMIVIILALVF